MLSAVIIVSGQDKPIDEESEVIRVDTELVNVPIQVTDRSGKPLLALKPGNFAVFEDGKPQKIEEFTATAAPFEVALLLDTSGSARGDLEMIRRAARYFIDSLRAGDRVSLISFNTANTTGVRSASVEVICELTSDRQELFAALEKVGTSNGTPYYDGLVKIAEAVFGAPPKNEFRGRRALVALTDGVDSTSSADYALAGELLGEKGISCYFIQVDTRDFFEADLVGDCQTATRFSVAQIRRYYRRFDPRSNVEKTFNFCDLGDFERLAISKGLYSLADEEMKDLAAVSGGKVFPVADLSEARKAFKNVADEIGTRYSLGYYSTNTQKPGEFRRIRVELKGLPAGTVVNAREGYVVPRN